MNKEEIENIKKEALEEIKGAKDKSSLESLRVKYLGRKGAVSEILGKIGQLPEAERPKAGELANRLKEDLHHRLDERMSLLATHEKGVSAIDVTLPGRKPPMANKHPLTQTIEKIENIFNGLGFRVVEGPEAETEYYNFEALNMPTAHVSREPFHTFYLGQDILLRSHTSPVQIRVMEKETPPVRIIAPGRAYRPDATDASHSPMFHQVEGLMVDEKVTFGDLKGILTEFAHQMFGPKIRMRFRPDFFPFTEPSADVSISCIICGGKGCSSCSHTGWMEILGAGMVDPEVFRAVNYDPERYTGFAFGMGVERIAMLKYGIDDIRLFFDNDLRFLRQF